MKNSSQPNTIGHRGSPQGVPHLDIKAIQALIDRIHDVSNAPTPRAIRCPRVKELTGVSRSQIYAMMDEKSPAFDQSFPRSFHLGDAPNSPTVWWECEVVDWLRSKAGTRDHIRGIGA